MRRILDVLFVTVLAAWMARHEGAIASEICPSPGDAKTLIDRLIDDLRSARIDAAAFNDRVIKLFPVSCFSFSLRGHEESFPVDGEAEDAPMCTGLGEVPVGDLDMSNGEEDGPQR